MLIEFLTSKFFFVVVMIAVPVGFVLMVKYMNKSIGLDFTNDVWKVIKTDPMATALYFGVRLIAVALLCGFAILAGSRI